MKSISKIVNKLAFLVMYWLFGLLFITSGCNSMTSDTKLEGNWEMTTYRINHQEEPDEIRVFWKFDADGSFGQRIVYATHETNEQGEWKLSDDEQWLIINYTRNKSVVEWEIKHIDDTLIQLEHTIPGFFVERSFKKR